MKRQEGPSHDPSQCDAPAERGAGSSHAISDHSGGERLRRVAGLLAIALGLGLVALMSQVGHFRLNVPAGVVLASLFAVCVLTAIGAFDAHGRIPVASSEARILLVPCSGLLVALVAWGAAVSAAVAGGLPWPRTSAALLIGLTFLGVLGSAWSVARAVGVRDKDARFLRRRGAWVLLVTTAIQLPLLGSFSLIDPWETHYGEVAREMIARDDWVSLWWAQDGWFWSKPILNFWAQGLSFSTFGVLFAPDAMLSGAALGLSPQPEWAVRMPGFLMTLGAAYALYKATCSIWGERVAWIGSLVLATTPYWVLLARQSMADMPYVAMLSIAMALFLVGISVPANRLVVAREVRVGKYRFVWSVRELLLVAVLATVGAQVALLLAQHVTLDVFRATHWISLHRDDFWAGSGMGNCEIVGNAPCKRHGPTYPIWQPYKSALLWTALCAAVLWFSRGEYRVRRVAFLGGWFFIALSFMAKGAPGLVLPVFVLAMYAVGTKRWRLLLDAQLHQFVLLLCCVALPWFVQMYARHGAGFIDRLFFHDMYKRAFVHVHDTNVGDDVSFGYYIWQLGYGLFPWSGLCGAAILWWLREQLAPPTRQRHAASFLVLWFVAAFAMFAVSLTKFHHYVLPAVPPVALLTGLMLDRLFPASSAERPGRAVTGAALVAAVVAGTWFAAVTLIAASVAVTTRGATGGGAAGLGAVSGILVAAAAGVLYRRQRVKGAPARLGRTIDTWTNERMLVLLAMVVSILIGRDLLQQSVGKVPGQMRLLHLFTYNYERAWPNDLSFLAELAAFVLLAVGAHAILMMRRTRSFGHLALVSLGVLFGFWTGNVYLVRLAPHWGQRELAQAYYKARSGPRECLVAYQMNWKGENFYTGNRIPAFVSSGEAFTDWIALQRSRGRNTMFFATEHGRIRSLREELGHPRHFEQLTTPALNNKFALLRVRFD